jgi:hypothetical protein
MVIKEDDADAWRREWGEEGRDSLVRVMMLSKREELFAKKFKTLNPFIAAMRGKQIAFVDKIDF